jgi:hypothetical protein
VSYYYDRQGNPIDRMDWAINPADKIVAKTTLPDGKLVSTVWLGIDHQFGNGPPLIFETMVFPADSYSDLDCERYSTETEALAGHEAMVKKWGGR